jgi:hypothetical protein
MARLTQPIMIASIALIGTIATASGGLAQHVRGCCHATGCSTISSSELQKGAGETYTVTATGEVFFPPEGSPGGMTPKTGRPFQWSDDGEFHRCGTSSFTQCLRVPRPGA